MDPQALNFGITTALAMLAGIFLLWRVAFANRGDGIIAPGLRRIANISLAVLSLLGTLSWAVLIESSGQMAFYKGWALVYWPGLVVLLLLFSNRRF